MKYVNLEKIKKVASTSNFVLATSIAIATSVVTPIVTAACLNNKSEKKLEQYVGDIEYVSGDRQFSLDELYIVEKEGNKYLCFRDVAGLKGIGLLEKQHAKDFLGLEIPITLRGRYEYYDVKTKELICLGEDHDVIISGLTLNLVEDVNNGKLEKEEINQEYIDNQFKQKVKYKHN